MAIIIVIYVQRVRAYIIEHYYKHFTESGGQDYEIERLYVAILLKS